jgi:hypothetical protein
MDYHVLQRQLARPAQKEQAQVNQQPQPAALRPQPTQESTPMSTEIQLPVFDQDEQSLESLLQDTQTRLFELRKRKEDRATAASRAGQLERLKEQFAADAQSLTELEDIGIPAAFAELRTAVEDRYTECHGRSGLYGQMSVSTKVSNATAKLVGLLDNLLRRKAQHEELRRRVGGLQMQVDGDVARAAKGAE